jgi:hypothetical protein
MRSSEAQTAMLHGKKLSKAKVQFARGEEVWSFTLDADEFIFRGLKLPQTETYERIGKFQERMVLLETFRQCFFHLYGEFVAERNNRTAWKKTKEAMRQWVTDRTALT